MLEDDLLEVISLMLEGRNTFLNRSINRLGQGHLRDTIILRYLVNEMACTELLNRVHQNHIRTTAAATTLLTMNLPQAFLDPVNVAPSAQQIEAATQVVVEPPANTNCAICQDSVTQNATQLRHCGHMYHTACFREWFSMSVRCPVCRHDIRN